MSTRTLSSTRAIESSGVRLINAIELVNVELPATQVEVCEACGFSQCSPGGWVAFRRIGERVVWIPAWDQMENGAWEESEYRPPRFLQKKGAPIFSAAAWARLRAVQGELPACHDLPWINSRDVARLCQWSAPGHLLGDYPLQPRLRRDLVIAVTDGDVITEMAAVDACLQAHFGTSRQMRLVPMDAAVRPVEFWLDLPGTPRWTCFAHMENAVCLLVDGNTALIAAGELTSSTADRLR